MLFDLSVSGLKKKNFKRRKAGGGLNLLLFRSDKDVWTPPLSVSSHHNPNASGS